MTLSIPSICQNDSESNLRISWEYARVRFDYRGITFLSETRYNYHELKQRLQIEYSKQLEKTFSINGITLSEQDYVKLILNRHEVDWDSCYFTEDYCGDSICQINLFAHVKIPLVIDDVEYRYGDMLPLQELSGKQLKFRKEERFLRKNRIIIQTE